MCCLEDDRIGLKNLQPGNLWCGKHAYLQACISTRILQRLSFSRTWFVASTSVVLM